MLRTKRYLFPFSDALRFTIVSFVLILSSCSILQKKVDPLFRYKTDSGFSFQVPMNGGWAEGPGGKGAYEFGMKSKKDGTTALAMVRHAPVMPSGTNKMGATETLEIFRRDFKRDSENGRVDTQKSTFDKKKFLGADCLFFKQLGEDRGVSPSMTITNDGIICLHPKNSNLFIWMAVSERRPLGAAALVSPNDEEKFFNSLQFH